jgi:hypothetical protein
MSVRNGSNTTFHCDNKIIRGSNNTIYGSNNEINGDHNIIDGSSNRIYGDYNKLIGGSNNQIYGDCNKNNGNGYNNVFTGDHNKNNGNRYNNVDITNSFNSMNNYANFSTDKYKVFYSGNNNIFGSTDINSNADPYKIFYGNNNNIDTISNNVINESKITKIKIKVPDEDLNEKEINPDHYKEEEICSICMERKIITVIVDCGHRCLCVTCSRKYQHQQNPQCPMCRKNITHIIKTY